MMIEAKCLRVSGVLPAAQIMMLQLPIRQLSTRGVQLVARRTTNDA